MSDLAVPVLAHAPPPTLDDEPPRPPPSAARPSPAPSLAPARADGGFQGYSYDAALQRQAAATAAATTDPAEVHAIATHGVAGSGAPLPFADRIGAAFGAHDVSDVRAHVGGDASAASRALGAQAYATGKDVAFAGAPDLHTAAHEAAHVVQQRAGVSLKGGVGEAGDPYERHADAVADAVVAGRSAEPLLDAMVGPASGGATAGVQRQAVQFWSGHEHRAVGNLAAVLATGNADFRTGEINRLRASFRGRAGETFDRHDFADGSIDAMGDKHSTDPTLVGLEARGRRVNRVRTNDQVIADPGGGPAVALPSSISFGAANEFGGDFAQTPEALAREHDDDDPVGHDFLVMVQAAETNINHFFPLNGAEYRAHHATAVRLARESFAAAQAGNAGVADAKVRQAMLEEGFAAHFLADTFAAGHMAPRALDRISTTGLDEGELGLNRSKHWHDALNAVTSSPGLPTTRGRFHGDDTMTGRELAIIGNDAGASLREVVTTAAGNPEPADIQIAAPAVPEILAAPEYAPIWRGMMGDYEQDLRAAERRGGHLTSDGGTRTGTADVAAAMRADVYGGERARLVRLAGSAWHGATLNFTVTVEGRPAPAGTEVWVQFFDKDMGFDRNPAGYTAGTLGSDAGAGLNDTDERIGGPRLVTVGDGGLGTITAPTDDAGDVYAVLYAKDSRLTPDAQPAAAGQFQPTEVPIGRTEVQGTSRGAVALPVTVSALAWSGPRLTFRVTADGRPASGRTLYVRFFDKDAGFDHDERGNLQGGVVDADETLGGLHAVAIADGAGELTATGAAVDPGDTYAVVFLDAAGRTPLARSPLMP
ncbi:MAG: DUF4157 domain-containing protein [Myxococcales bacterium]|nr:DUF4157 domain-containing protein [Myxococcales bacterium]